jgi:predicted AlkP superfamily phosphohydrolase/phosphomutase
MSLRKYTEHKGEIVLKNNQEKNKTVVIGLDGATFDLMGPWIEEGKLPHIKELMDKGCSGVLESTIPPLSPVAWTSFMTGMNPGKHGIFDFVEPFQNGALGTRLNNRKDCKQIPIWRYLNNEGHKTVILNVPMTFPPDELDGLMVSGMDTPHDNATFTYPRE